MISAVVLINVQRNQINETAQSLLEIEGVAEVYSVTGEYDLVAIVRVRRYDQMAAVVPQHIASVAGVKRTHTLMAFQHFSRHDLDRMWGIGLEAEPTPDA